MANSHSLDIDTTPSKQYASGADDAALSISGDISMEAWIKRESIGAHMAIIAKGDANNDWSYRLHIDPNNKLNLVISDDGGFDAGHTITCRNDKVAHILSDTGVWHHVAVTFDISTETAIFYVDTDPGTTFSSGNIGATIHDGNADFALGTDFNNGNPDGSFDGKIDDARLWSDVRTAGEISSNWETELVGDEANLVGYWKLNNDYTDETSNNNTLTPVNSPVFSTDIPFPVSTFTPKMIIY